MPTTDHGAGRGFRYHRSRPPNTTCPASGARGRGQLLPPHRSCVKPTSPWIPQGSQRPLSGWLGPGGRGTPAPRPSYLVLTGPRLGHPWGARRSEARPRLVRTWPPPARPRRCGCASAAWHTGAGRGPREASPVGCDSSGSRGSPRTPRLLPLAPRPCALPRRQPFSLRSARPDKLVSLLQGGASRLPLAAAVAARRLGTRLELGPGAVPPSALPRSLPRVERGRAARPGAVVRRPAPVPRSRAPEAGGQP